ncbi:unnamed protein product [Brassicogethes aeneus]|uniref:Uncharacterized protein n=1 Tax=Brassicogethes aeneus TaxID=1431903 RepID=A0A9P0BD16_BRAAE|nr:unnamed protein product [Brassicogethes aeneus]
MQILSELVPKSRPQPIGTIIKDPEPKTFEELKNSNDYSEPIVTPTKTKSLEDSSLVSIQPEIQVLSELLGPEDNPQSVGTIIEESDPESVEEVQNSNGYFKPIAALTKTKSWEDSFLDEVVPIQPAIQVSSDLLGPDDNPQSVGSIIEDLDSKNVKKLNKSNEYFKPIAVVSPRKTKSWETVVPIQPATQILSELFPEDNPQSDATIIEDSDPESVEEPYQDSGSEFQPSNEESSDSDNEMSDQRLNHLTKKNKVNTVVLEAEHHDPTNDDLCDDEELARDEASPKNVMIKSAVKLDGKRIRNKGHSCFFCQKIVINNLARHFELKHNEETEVAKILAKPKKSKERRDAFLALSRNGDFYHNCETLSLKKEELILTRRPTPDEIKFSSYTDYGPCPECLGFMLKRHIWHHLKYSCQSKEETVDENNDLLKSGKKMPIAESNALLNGILGKDVTVEFTNNIINKFKNDSISNVCKDDQTILKFGSFLFEKYDITQSELIRQSMRQLGRLTLQLIEKCLGDALKPEKFDAIIKATKQLCVETKEVAKRPEFGVPSL